MVPDEIARIATRSLVGSVSGDSLCTAISRSIAERTKPFITGGAASRPTGSSARHRRSIREAAHLAEGDPVEFEIISEGILLRPKKVIDSTQAWFWTEAWQAGERAASADIA